MSIVRFLVVCCLVSVMVGSTPASATPILDGVINGGEYASSTSGVGGSFGDFFGAGSTLHWDTDGTSLFIGLEATNNGGGNAGVLYLDTAAGGPSTTGDIRNVSGGNDQTFIAGSVGTPPPASDLTFATGFAPEFGLLMEFGGFNNLYPIVTGVGALPYDVGGGIGLAGSTNSGDNLTREIQIDLATLGASGDIDFVGTVISNSAWRSNEFFGVAASTIPGGSIQQQPFTLNAGDFGTITLVPEPSTVALATLCSLAVFTRRRRK